jgi:hypothetical protein
VVSFFVHLFIYYASFFFLLSYLAELIDGQILEFKDINTHTSSVQFSLPCVSVSAATLNGKSNKEIINI